MNLIIGKSQSNGHILSNLAALYDLLIRLRNTCENNTTQEPDTEVIHTNNNAYAVELIITISDASLPKSESKHMILFSICGG